MYIDEELNLYEISDRIGITPSGVLYALRKRGVKMRTKSEGELLKYKKKNRIA
jgi:predicted DNA-binding protein YlxM (UPF0122 family)